MEVNPILKEQGRKKHVLVARGIDCVKMILAFLTEVIVLYIQAFIVQVRVFRLKESILGCKVCLAIFSALIGLKQERKSESE